LPEGDAIFRAARTLHRALAGRTITRFQSVFPSLSRVDVDTPIRGRTIERVEARGKHLLMWLSGGLVLRTHMRMHGSWHIYRPHERWRRPHHSMRIVVQTEDFHAVAFDVPVAEFATPALLERTPQIRQLGPDPLADDFDAALAAERIRARADVEIADALLDQTAIAGIGNVYKSEVLFAGRVNPFVKVGELAREDVDRLVAAAVRFMRANVAEHAPAAIETFRGLRRTTGSFDPGARLWVYGRGGKPCRRCGGAISRRRQGPYARSTYWCPRCQPANGTGADSDRGSGPQKNHAPRGRTR
jgi:endonuclease-8